MRWKQMQYRIFVSDPGNYNIPNKCVFVAAFPERKAAVNYVQYMFGKKRYAGKDVLVRKDADYEVDPGEDQREIQGKLYRCR